MRAALVGLLLASAATLASAASITLVAPPLGSRATVFGLVTGVPDPTQYHVCIYLQDNGGRFYGPKPLEAAADWAPVAASGAWSYAPWSSNAVFDPATPAVLAFLHLASAPTCETVTGGAAIPPVMFNDAAWVKTVRTTALSLAVVAPPLGSTSPVGISVSGIEPNQG